MKKSRLLLNFMICWLGWGIPIGLLCIVVFGSILKGLILGISGGIIFAAIIILFIIILSLRKDKLRESYGIEGTVLYDGAANRMVNKEAVGGWIFLMEDKFCCVSHAINIVAGKWVIPYSDIRAVTKGKMIRSIAVHTKEGKVEEFVVDNSNEWIKFLKEKCIL